MVRSNSEQLVWLWWSQQYSSHLTSCEISSALFWKGETGQPGFPGSIGPKGQKGESVSILAFRDKKVYPKCKTKNVFPN